MKVGGESWDQRVFLVDTQLSASGTIADSRSTIRTLAADVVAKASRRGLERAMDFYADPRL